MKILISHSYFLQLDPKQWAQQKPYPPLATLIAVACLQKAGHEVRFIDSNFLTDTQEAQQALETWRPDFFVLYEDGFNYLTKMCLTNMREAAFEMMDKAASLDIPVWVSGSDATDHYKEYLEKGAQAVLKGEAEQTLLELAAGRPLSAINGIWYKTESRVEATAPRKVNTHLDDLPFPAWEVLDIEPYQKAWKKHGYFSINVATTRGCPFKCNWCAKPIYGNRYNSHSPKYIVDLLLDMQRCFSFDHIWFCDDIFGLKPRWVQQFNEQLQQADRKWKYKIQSRADLLVKEDTVMALAQSGCDEVWIGAESGSQKVLDAMDKGTTVAQIVDATALMKAHNVKPCFFLQFGYPTEEWSDIKATIDMLKTLKPHDIGVSVSYPLPGTKFYERVKNELQQKANWTDSDELLLMYKGTYSASFYKDLHRYVHRKFRSLRAWEMLVKGDGTARQKWSFAYHTPLSWWNGFKMKKSLQSGE